MTLQATTSQLEQVEGCSFCTVKEREGGLEFWWQLYRTSLPVRDLENFRPMDFCLTECTYNTDWLHNSKQQIGTNLEGSIIIQFKVLSGHFTGRTGKQALTQNIWCPSHNSNWTQQKPKHYCLSPLAQWNKTKNLWVGDGQIIWQRNKDSYLPVSMWLCLHHHDHC